VELLSAMVLPERGHQQEDVHSLKSVLPYYAGRTAATACSQSTAVLALLGGTTKIAS